MAKRSSVPLAAVRNGTAMQSSGTGRVGIVEGSCGYRACVVSIQGKLILSRNLGYKMRGRHVPKRISDRPQQRYATEKPGKIHGRDGVGIVEASCGYWARGVSIRGKFEKPAVRGGSPRV